MPGWSARLDRFMCRFGLHGWARQPARYDGGTPLKVWRCRDCKATKERPVALTGKPSARCPRCLAFEGQRTTGEQRACDACGYTWGEPDDMHVW